MGSGETAAGRILKAECEETAKTDATSKVKPQACRFHDLRHTAVSRMLNAGIPLAKIAKIVGWSNSTMVLMATRYGHFSLNDLRGAVESISGAGIEAGSLVFSPVSDTDAKAKQPN